MKIVIDECLPKRMVHFFPKEEAWTVPQIGLAGYKDSELLRELEKRSIDVFITIDGNMEFQQQLKERSFGTVILRSVSNRYDDLKIYREQLGNMLRKIERGMIVHMPG